jgi:hypothetical protein
LYFVLGDLERSRLPAALAIEQSRSDPSSLCDAHHAMAGSLIAGGEIAAAHEHFEAAIAACDGNTPHLSAFGSDLGVFSLAWSAHTLWLLGDADAAVVRADEAVALAKRRGHVYSETLALAYAGLTHQFRRDLVNVTALRTSGRRALRALRLRVLPDWADVLLGWAAGQEGRPEEGVRLIEGALVHLDAQRAQGRRPYYLSLLAETLLAARRHGRAASVLDTAIASAVGRKDLWWLPQLLCQKSEFEPSPGREQLLRKALETARGQQSRALEQRILAALAHLSTTQA